jgi:CubicO group peptidase (beta-lactamase class C family)
VKDLASNAPVTVDTMFQLASTSKAFTSTAIAMLADDGKLSFDDPVRQHLRTSASPNPAPIARSRCATSCRTAPASHATTSFGTTRR